MTITLITQEEYNTLKDIQSNYPVLTFQNDGYQYIDYSKFTDEEREKYNIVSDILKKSVKGFHKFFNFRLNKSRDVEIRFDYDWIIDEPVPTRLASFIGVGYLKLIELLNGFENPDKIIKV